MASDTMDIFEIDRVISVKPVNRKMYKHSGKSLVPINNQLFLKQEKDLVYNSKSNAVVHHVLI